MGYIDKMTIYDIYQPGDLESLYNREAATIENLDYDSIEDIVDYIRELIGDRTINVYVTSGEVMNTILKLPNMYPKDSNIVSFVPFPEEVDESLPVKSMKDIVDSWAIDNRYHPFDLFYFDDPDIELNDEGIWDIEESTQAADVAVGEIYDYGVGSHSKKPKNSMLDNLEVDTEYKKGKK